MGCGFRYKCTQSVDFGLAYEFPLTNEKDGLMKNRLTCDLVWSF